ncbi:MAG: hypothetical protein JNK56_02445 [Myxococcales bacterium]|nr:hypothetical protein [Myxococcales bacterium]
MQRGPGVWGVLVIMTATLACKAGQDAGVGSPGAPVVASEQPPVVASGPAEAPASGPAEAPAVVAEAPVVAASAPDPADEAPTVVPTTDERPIPPGSGDYGAVLARARKFRRGEISFAALRAWVVARKLPPHPLTDKFVIMPVPAPPPGVPFDPMMMPPDWVGTWGEVAMAHFAGALTREEYDRLHAAAHPSCSRAP